LNHADLKTLISINSKFLTEYINNFYAGEVTPNTYKKLGFVWDLDNYIEIVEEATNLIIENSIYLGITEHPLNIFFNTLTEEQKLKAKQFILGYIEKNNTDSKKVSAIFDVIRHSIKDFFEEAFLHYLNFNTDVEIFKKINWRGSGGVHSGNVIIGDLHAKEWQAILTVADKSPNHLDLIPIKAHIRGMITFELKFGEEERKSQFVHPEIW
jgi:hypothetical protein